MVRKLLAGIMLSLTLIGANVAMPAPASATPYAPGPIRDGFGFTVNAPITNVDGYFRSCLNGPNVGCRYDGMYILAANGAVYAIHAPYFGGANGQSYFAGRTASFMIKCADAGDHFTGYVIVTTSGESYHYGPGSWCVP